MHTRQQQYRRHRRPTIYICLRGLSTVTFRYPFQYSMPVTEWNLITFPAMYVPAWQDSRVPNKWVHLNPVMVKAQFPTGHLDHRDNKYPKVCLVTIDLFGEPLSGCTVAIPIMRH